MSGPPPWQYVALAVVGSSFFLGVFALIPEDQPEMRMALLGLLMLAGNAAVARWITGHVSQVKQEVSDAKDDLVAEIQQIDVSRETGDVSRETNGQEGPR